VATSNCAFARGGVKLILDSLPQSPQQNQGFLVEVLVAILITMVAAVQCTMAIAAVFKARAQELLEANNLIQQDLKR